MILDAFLLFMNWVSITKNELTKNEHSDLSVVPKVSRQIVDTSECLTSFTVSAILFNKIIAHFIVSTLCFQKTIF